MKNNTQVVNREAASYSAISRRQAVMIIGGAVITPSALLEQSPVAAASTSRIDFARLQPAIEAASRNASALELRAAELSVELENVLSAAIRLDELSIVAVTADMVTFAGMCAPARVFGWGPRIAIQGTLFRDGSYTVVLAPTPETIDRIGGQLRTLLRYVPPGLQDSFWFAASSLKVDDLRIEIPGREAVRGSIEAGANYLFQFKSEFLKQLGLAESMFGYAGTQMPPTFAANIGANLRIPPLLDLEVERVVLDRTQLPIKVMGKGTLELLGAKLSVNGWLEIGLDRFAFEIPVPSAVSNIAHTFFRALHLSDIRAKFDGTVSAYSVSVRGTYSIAGSGNGGEFHFKYQIPALSAAAGVPDLSELTANKLFLRDVFTVMSGVPVPLPAFLDDAVRLEEVAFYYATRPGLVTGAGAPSPVGVKVQSGAALLGYRAYFEMSALDQQQSAKLLLNPLRFANLLEIAGNSTDRPAGTAEQWLEPNPLRLEIDSRSGSITADASVKLMRFPASTGVSLLLAADAITFALSAELPKIAGVSFEGAVHAGRVALASGFDAVVSPTLRWMNGKLKVGKLAYVKGKISLEGDHAGITRREVECTVALAGVRMPQLRFQIEGDLSDLYRQLAAEVERMLRKTLESLEAWLAAVVAGLIVAADNVKRTFFYVGEALRREWQQGAEDAAKLLKKAGAAFEHAWESMGSYFDSVYSPQRELQRAFDSLWGIYTEDEYIAGMERWAKEAMKGRIGAAFQAADLLVRFSRVSVDKVFDSVWKVANGGLDAVVVLKAVVSELGKQAERVGQYLFKRFPSEARKVGLWLAGAYDDLNRDGLRDVLKASGYAASVAADATTNVFRESGKFVNDVRREAKKILPQFTL
ncbi:protein of unknown function (plasmid) [Cupriavidus taiwanensis]|uniref:Uncharacterized protein n=1 Tax=Cupriavidus taiwanensis TaxID=164546 RepID=A0A375ISQ2_9BURK|nr:hypothetical protein [Cupriavidus taiwanensis]SPK77188.1 protein of unknown function [Cupriavidus taiwanensis]